MQKMKENSIDSVVTDPPYELGFMGKGWDKTGIAYNIDLWKEVLRVLKPGGYLLAFGGTRTYHRMASAIEDAGFEIRDMMQWLYGSGFPKSMDVSKSIDKKLGKTRKVIGVKPGHEDFVNRTTNGDTVFKDGMNGFDRPWMHDKAKKTAYHMATAPASDEAKQWSGWGTALKPANEPMVLARKPLSEKTVADNVMRWGTGGINIDDSRIPSTEMPKSCQGTGWASVMKTNLEQGYRPKDYYENQSGFGYTPNQQGRFPANVLLDETAAAILDEQSGTLTSGKVSPAGFKGEYKANIYGKYANSYINPTPVYGDTGGASRFFYCAKTSQKERGSYNDHVTVKPIKLMEYLVTLVTPPLGTVLDPFAGSGTTGIACAHKGFNFLGIELDAHNWEICVNRLRRCR